MMLMKYINIFLLLGILLVSCKQSQEEEYIDIDQMAMTNQDDNPHINGELFENPHEILVEEPFSVE